MVRALAGDSGIGAGPANPRSPNLLAEGMLSPPRPHPRLGRVASCATPHPTLHTQGPRLRSTHALQLPCTASSPPSIPHSSRHWSKKFRTATRGFDETSYLANWSAQGPCHELLVRIPPLVVELVVSEAVGLCVLSHNAHRLFTEASWKVSFDIESEVHFSTRLDQVLHNGIPNVALAPSVVIS